MSTNDLRAAALVFFKALFLPEDALELRPMDPSGEEDAPRGKYWPTSFESAVDMAFQHSDNGWNAYFGVFPRIVREGLFTGNAAVSTMTCAWTEMDWIKLVPGGEDALRARSRQLGDVLREGKARADEILAMLPETSIVVGSGAGYHLYWMLRERLSLEAKEAAPRAEALLAAVNARAEGDKGVKDLARILRVPGTINFPNARKRALARGPVATNLIRLEPAVRYSLAELEEMFAVPSPGGSDPGPGTTAPLLAEGAEATAWDLAQMYTNEKLVTIWNGEPLDGDRSKRDVRFALAALVDGFSEDAVGRLLVSMPGSKAGTRDAKYLGSCLGWARKEAAKERGAPRNGTSHASFASFAGDIEIEDEKNKTQWPDPPSDEVYHGLAGEIVKTIAPHSEADPIALLLQFLTAFGNLVGRTPFFLTEAVRHFPILFLVLVGVSSKGRKGTSWGWINRLLALVEGAWSSSRIMSGLSSGEGLIAAVADPDEEAQAAQQEAERDLAEAVADVRAREQAASIAEKAAEERALEELTAVTRVSNAETAAREADDTGREAASSELRTARRALSTVQHETTRTRRASDKAKRDVTKALQRVTRVQRRATRAAGNQGAPGDKRLLIVEQEFAAPLKLLARDGNILSAVLRNAWDDGNLRTLTKNSPLRATDAHVSIVGHGTKQELNRYLNENEAGNGFGNRFLWACAKRSKALPDGGTLTEADLAALAQKVVPVLARARELSRIERDDDARRLWHEVYPELSEGKPGLLGAMTARAEAQVLRLSMLYALLDQSEKIRVEHLRAALALWKYCEASARFVFGDALGDPVADAILQALKGAPDGLTRKELSDFFGRHKSAERLSQALGLLLETGHARRERVEDTGGRPAERWFAMSTIAITKQSEGDQDAKKATKANDPPPPGDGTSSPANAKEPPIAKEANKADEGATTALDAVAAPSAPANEANEVTKGVAGADASLPSRTEESLAQQKTDSSASAEITVAAASPERVSPERP